MFAGGGGMSPDQLHNTRSPRLPVHRDSGAGGSHSTSKVITPRPDHQ